MITRQGGDIVFECDDCGETYHTMTDFFPDAEDDLLSDGWRIKQEDGQWQHLCPVCQ